MFSMVTVTWDETDVSSSPVAGLITFQVSAALCDMATGQIAEALPPRSYPFRGAGASDPLVANDSAGAVPPDSHYTVTIAVPGQRPYSFTALISHANGSTQTLAFLRANAAIPAVQYARYLPLPSGVPAAGQVPFAVADGSTVTAWGSVAGDRNYTLPFTALSTVNVDHGMSKYPAVTVIDTAGDVVIGDVAYTGLNSLTVSFSAPFSGTVICNLGRETMSTQWRTPINMVQNALLNAVMHPLAAAPSSPVAGQVYFDTTLKQFGVWTGTAWAYLGTGSGTVTSASVVSANGFAGTVATATTTPAITVSTSVTGLLKGNGTAVSAAVSGTDYAPATSVTGLLKGSGSGGFASAVSATDYAPATTGSAILKASSGGFASATAGTDYLAPSGSGAALTGLTQSQISGLAGALALLAPLANPVLTGTPTAPTPSASDNSTAVATTAFVQAVASGLAQGIQFKPTATVAATAALPAGTYSNGSSGVGATFTVTAAGTTVVDGHALAALDLVLLTAQAPAFQNGLYTVTTAGTTGVSTVLTRHADMDQPAEIPGAFIPVGSAGTNSGNSLWLANPSGTVTVGTTSIPVGQLNGATDLLPGAGLAISGNTVSVENGGVLTVPHGGTGGATAAAAKTSLGFGSTYNSAAIGDGTSTTLTVTHSLNNAVPLVQVYDVTGTYPQQVLCDVLATSANTVQLVFGSAPASGGIKCVVVG